MKIPLIAMLFVKWFWSFGIPFDLMWVQHDNDWVQMVFLWIRGDGGEIETKRSGKTKSPRYFRIPVILLSLFPFFVHCQKQTIRTSWATLLVFLIRILPILTIRSSPLCWAWSITTPRTTLRELARRDGGMSAQCTTVLSCIWEVLIVLLSWLFRSRGRRIVWSHRGYSKVPQFCSQNPLQ